MEINTPCIPNSITDFDPVAEEVAHRLENLVGLRIMRT